MKNFYFLILLISLFACSRSPEPNLQLSNPEAFAFDLGDSWEVNTSVKAKGFAQNEIKNVFNSKLSYSIDLITPNSDSIKSIFNNNIDQSEDESIEDIILEAQIEIDSSFSLGSYKLKYNVKDEYSMQTKSISIDFDVSK